jgi:hypothetical protein
MILGALGFVPLCLDQWQVHAMLRVLLVFKLSNATLVFMKLVLLVTTLGVRRVLPVPKQIPEQILGQQRVLLVALVRIPYFRTLLNVWRVPPLPMFQQ